jgi:tetratricopeptide (TPR) repeat protein
MLLAFAVLGGCREEPPRMIEAGGELATAEAWLDVYPEVTDHPRLPRAREIFETMREVAGTHADLVVLEDLSGAHAFALPDQTVILSKPGLELCYEGVTQDEGDARLALILGHELAHVASDDFWHASALASLRGVDEEDEQLQRLRELLALDGKGRQVRELRADQWGFLALIEAGFDPKPLLEGGQTFFEAWVGDTAGYLAYDDPDHPTPAARALFVRGKLAEVAGRIDLFERGMEVFQEAEALAAATGGRELLPGVEALYREAADYFRKFERHFDGREVLNNQALAHLRLAAGALASCDGRLVNRYYLPTALDPVTLANVARLRGEGGYSSPCFEQEDYQRHMKEARRLLKEAVDRDPEYLPARLNLVAAYVLDEKEAQAAEAARLARERWPNDSKVAASWAAAHFAYLGTGSTLFDPAKVFDEVQELHRRFPDEPGIAFNLASALSRNGRAEEAEPVWRAFLLVEPDSAWAEVARERLGEEPGTAFEVADR